MSAAIHEKSTPSVFAKEDAIPFNSVAVSRVLPIWTDTELDEVFRLGGDVGKNSFDDAVFVILRMRFRAA
jgi:hypothetical protein